MTIKIKSFIINNVSTTDAQIQTGIGLSKTVFSISVVPISSIKSRVIVAYND